MHPPRRSQLLSAAFTVALSATACALPAAACAQLRPDSFSRDILKPARLVTQVDLSDPIAPRRSLIAPAANATHSWLGSSVQMELPRDAGSGTYTRPKLVVGVPSTAMSGWLRTAGFETEHCMLPMLRARTRMSGSGDVNGTLWVYARCTFH